MGLANKFLRMFVVLRTLQRCSCCIKTRQCHPLLTRNGTIDKLVPPLEWDGEQGSGHKPVMVHLSFDIWNIPRVDDATQMLSLMVTFSERWTDPRLKEYCKDRIFVKKTNENMICKGN